MSSRKASPTKQLRYLFILMTITSLLFLYYASSSMYLKSTVFQFYKNIGHQATESTIFYQQSDSSSELKEIVYNFTDTKTPNPIVNATKQPPINSNANNRSTLITALNELNTISIAAPMLISNTTSSSLLETCPLIPPNLGTRIKINQTLLEIEAIENLPEIKKLNISTGGHWSPKTCQARYRVAIIIPYRKREENLKLFLRHMHPFLSRQQLDYGIYIAEPVQNVTFNRGILMNIGYKEALKDTDKWDCFIFHDVDLLPEDDRNIYSCPEIPRHMSSAVNTLHYRLPYDAIFGGVTGFSKEHYEKINGFSNLYFGWGGEDDDLRARVLDVGLAVARYPLEIGRYYMATHTKDTPNPKRFNLLKSGKKRLTKDGITSLKYKVLSFEKKKLFTWILVDYNQAEIEAQAKT